MYSTVPSRIIFVVNYIVTGSTKCTALYYQLSGLLEYPGMKSDCELNDTETSIQFYADDGFMHWRRGLC